MGSQTEVAPGTVGLVFAVPVVGVAVLLSVPTAAAAVSTAVSTDVTILPHSFGLGFAFGDSVIRYSLQSCAA